MENDGDLSSFWFQPPVRSHRRSNSPIVNPVILIIVLPILAILLVFFLVPPFLSNVSSIFRPSSVKKSWDSLNIVLVVFAILCGVLARRNDDGNSPVAETDGVAFEDSDRKFFRSPVGIRRLRSSSSYPDLRQESGWETGSNQYRFYDDFDVDLNLHRSVDVSSSPHHRLLRRSRSEIDQADVKVIPLDKFVNQSSPVKQTPSPSPSPSLAPPPPPPPPAGVKSHRRHTNRSVPKREKVKKRVVEETESVEIVQPAPPPAPPPLPPAPLAPPNPPPPMAEIPRARQKHEKLERKKSKDIANTLVSLYNDYNQSKRKRKSKSRHIYDNATESPPSDSVPPPASPAPPPPPPPPPLSVLQTMFRKGSKSKRIHSFSASVPPPPPPPPPPTFIFNNLFKNNNKSKRFTATASVLPPSPPPLPPSSVLNTLFKTGNKSKRFMKNSISQPEVKSPTAPAPPPIASTRKFSTGKPPLPAKASSSSISYYERDEYLNSGSQSPLIPEPPPLPPFKMPEMKYVFRGDFVKISSNQSSRSTSPEREEAINSESSPLPGLSVGSGFCPSPDVNVKAATFIARLRDEWKLEKINSVKEKQKMGPSSGPNMGPN